MIQTNKNIKTDHAVDPFFLFKQRVVVVLDGISFCECMHMSE